MILAFPLALPLDIVTLRTCRSLEREAQVHRHPLAKALSIRESLRICAARTGTIRARKCPPEKDMTGWIEIWLEHIMVAVIHSRLLARTVVDFRSKLPTLMVVGLHSHHTATGYVRRAHPWFVRHVHKG